MKENKISRYVLFLLILSLYFGRINVDLGFALKPYMILSVITFPFLLNNSVKIKRLFNYEKLLVIFITSYSMTALQFRYPDKHLKFIFAFFVILLFYFFGRTLINDISFENIDRIIITSGFFGLVASFIYYILGLVSIPNLAISKNEIYYGVMVDRGMPRFIGLLSSDPNIAVFFITIPLLYSMTNRKSKLHTLVFLLSSILSTLSFSRGAILSLSFTVVIFILLERGKDLKFKNILMLFLLIYILYEISGYFNLDLLNVLEKRLLMVKTDGGSGRDQLWINAVQTFKNNPIFGIGINSTTSYGLEFYNDGHYVHNTVLEVLSEGGIFIFLIFVILWFVLIKESYKLYKEIPESKFIFLSMIAMFFQMLFLSILYNEAFYLLLILLYWFKVHERNKSVKKNENTY